MSTSNNLSATLARINKMKNERQTGPKTDKPVVNFFKAKAGRSNVLLLPQSLTGDPFMEWGTHKNLLEPAYKDVTCLKHNFGEHCLVCEVVDDLKKQNFKGNMHIWKPLELKIRYFSPVIDLDDLDKGVQYWSYGKTVLSQFENWLLNLEEAETEFYNPESPEKIIVNYNPNASAADMYKLDKKTTKAFSKSQVQQWQEVIKPLTEVFTFKPQDEETTLLIDKFMERIQNEIVDNAAHSSDGNTDAITPDTLSKLKK